MTNTISVYLPGLLLTYSAFLLLLVSPGPNVLAVMATSMSVNRVSGVALGLGIAGGTLFWSCLTVFGVSKFITNYAWSLYFLKIFGGLYLFWLAYKSFRLSYSDEKLQTPHASAKGSFKYFLHGLFLNISNPKAAFGWVAIISLGIVPDAPKWVYFALIFGTVLTSVFFHVIYAVIFSTQPLISLYKRAARWIHGVFGTVFLYAGFKVLSSKS